MLLVPFIEGFILLRYLPVQGVNDKLHFALHFIDNHIANRSLILDLLSQRSELFAVISLRVSDDIPVHDTFLDLLQLLSQLSRCYVDLVLNFSFELREAALPIRRCLRRLVVQNGSRRPN